MSTPNSVAPQQRPSWVARGRQRMIDSDGIDPLKLSLVTGGLCLVASIAGSLSGAGATAWILVALIVGLGGWASWIDARSHRLPDAILLPLAIGVAVTLVSASALEGNLGLLVRAVVAAGIVGVVAILIAIFCGLGLGDAKLLIILGGALAYVSPLAVVAGVCVGFVLAFPHALGSVIKKEGANIPLGPYLVGGSAVVLIIAASAHL